MVGLSVLYPSNQLKGHRGHPDLEYSFRQYPGLRSGLKRDDEVRVSLNSGASLKAASAMMPRVPSAPVYTLFMSYPETFFTTLPPPFVTSPFGLTTFIPINLSLIAPNCARIGPLELVDRMPSMVALSA